MRPAPLVALVALAVSTLGLRAPANAAVITWTNLSGGNWNTSTNWNSGAGPVPGVGDDAVISLDGTYTVTLDVNASVNSLVLGGTTGTQTLSSSNHTLTLAAASSIGAQGAVQLAGSTINGTGSLDNAGLIRARGTSALGLTMTTVGGSTLRCEGDVSSGTSSLTCANGFANHGTIELTTTHASFNSSLTVTAGTLINESDGSINTLAGAGGAARVLTAEIDNRGTITLAHPLGLARGAADHLNSGTLTVGADLALTQSGMTPSFTTTGTVNIAPGRTFAVTSGAFSYGAGTIAGSGTLSLVNSAVLNLGAAFSNATTTLSLASATVNGPQTLTNAAGRTLTLSACTINAPLVNEGTLVSVAGSSIGGALTTAAGSTLRCEANGTQGSSTLTIAAGFTNNGTIQLTTLHAGFNVTLNVTAGTLVNETGASIQTLAGAGGAARNLNAALDNRGTLTIGHPTTLNRASADHLNSGTIDVSEGDLTVSQGGTTPSLTTTGTVNIAAGRTLSVTGGNFFYNAGSVTGSGTLSFSSGAVLNLGAAFSNATTTLLLTGTTVNGPQTLTNAAGRTVTLITCVINAPLVNEGTLVNLAGSSINGALATAGGSTLRCEANGGNGSSTLTIATGFTNNGTIQLTTLNAGFSATLNVTTGTLANETGASIQSLAGAGGAPRNLNVELDNRGTLTIGHPTTLSRAAAHHLNSGTIDVSGGDLALFQSGTTPTFTTTGAVNIASGRTLAVTGGNFFYNAGSVTGSGTLSFSSGAVLNLGAAFSNATTTLLLTGTTVNGPQTLTNGRTLTLNGCTINAPLIDQGLLVNVASSNLNGAFTAAAGCTLRCEANVNQGSSTLTIASGFTNHGTIELTTLGPAFPATLNVTAGTLVNETTGAINALAGSGGSARVLNAEVDNRGTVTLGHPTSLQRAAAHHVNSGTIAVNAGVFTVTQSGAGPSFTNSGTVSVASGATLTVAGDTLFNDTAGTLQGGGTIVVSTATLINAGAIRPGTSPGLLSITGNLVQRPTASLTVEIGGPTVGTTYDRLAVSGSAEVNGTFAVSLINGFVPTPGQTFQVLSRASGPGAYASLAGLDLGNGLSFEPLFGPTGLVLRTVAQTWVHLVPMSGSPLARDGHSAVYDPGSNRMTIFGGRGNAGPLNDVWVLGNADGTGGFPTWIPLAPTGTPPAPRANHTAVYQPATNRMIVFGGDDASGATPATMGDVWVLSNANGFGGTPAWSLLSPTGGPPAARSEHGAAIDVLTNRMIVFGGDTAPGACTAGLNDAWVLTNADGIGGGPVWTPLAPAGTPPGARSRAEVAYDLTNNRLIVLGGRVPCGAPNAELWTLTDANGIGAPAWTQQAPMNPTPVNWSLERAVFDPSTSRLTAFGGLIGASATDTVLSLSDANGVGGTPIWTDRAPYSPHPAPRSLHSAVQVTQKMLVFGGLAASGRLNDLWLLEENQGRVVDVPPPPAEIPAFTTGFSRPPAPNPARGAASFAVSVASRQHVEVSVWDIAGRRVARLFRGEMAPGERVFAWGGEASSGNHAAAGLYFLKFVGERRSEMRRLVLLP